MLNVFLLSRCFTQFYGASCIFRNFAYIPDISHLFLKNCVIPKEIFIKTDNLRYDKMLSMILDVSRHKIELQTLQNNVYINETELKKKGKKLKKNDVIEVDFESTDKKYLFVRSRVEVSKLKEDKSFFNVTFKLYKCYGYVLRNI